MPTSLRGYKRRLAQKEGDKEIGGIDPAIHHRREDEILSGTTE